MITVMIDINSPPLGPLVRQQTLQLQLPAIAYAFEYIRKPLLGIDVPEFAGAKQQVYDCSVSGGLVVAAEETVFAPQCQQTHGLLCEVVVDEAGC